MSVHICMLATESTCVRVKWVVYRLDPEDFYMMYKSECRCGANRIFKRVLVPLGSSGTSRVRGRFRVRISSKFRVLSSSHVLLIERKNGQRIMAPLLERTMLSDLTEMPFIKIGDFKLEFELGPPSPELQEVARKELRETPEIQKQSIARLQELLKAEKDLKCPLDNETWLIRFLRPCKYYPESSLELIKHYYKFKVKHASVYDNLKPSREKNIFEQNILTVLPNRDQCGRRVLIIELGKKWKHNKCSLDEVYKGCVLYLEAAMLEPTTQIAGAIIIFDMDGLTLQQTWQFTPPFAKRIVDLLQDAMPIRIKNIHIVNQPYIFNMVFALFKPFLKEKLKNRIIFHGTDRKSLHQYISPKCLPAQYGGTLEIKTVDGPQWYSLLLQVDKEYDAISSYGYKK